MNENKEITIQDVINKRKEHSRRVDTMSDGSCNERWDDYEI